MKKIFLILAILLFVPINGLCADVIPQNVSLENTNTFGLYQAPNKLTFYKEPTEQSYISHTKVVVPFESFVISGSL